MQKGKNTPKTKPNPKTTEGEKEKNFFSDINVSMKSGRLTRDAELVGKDNKFIKIRLACHKEYQKAGEGEPQVMTNYFDALVSEKLTEAFKTAKEFKKGDWVYIKGEDSSQSFDTPEGYRKTANTIFAYHAVFKKAALPKSQDDNEISETTPDSEAVPSF